ncbi:hypothetical protein, partial [Pseudomonas aeruginosa]|uniref:hypothetical protein n=1 Tax=Pseudomonas aeruginosa TaxID=287 RepID=UPI0034A543E2
RKVYLPFISRVAKVNLLLYAQKERQGKLFFLRLPATDFLRQQHPPAKYAVPLAAYQVNNQVGI